MSKRKLLLANNPLLAGPSLSDRERPGGTPVPYREIPIEDILPDPAQPRREFDSEKLQELADSIEVYGVMSPILVRQDPTSGRYILISGERRYRASQIVGLKRVPVIVRSEVQEDDASLLAMQLVENLQREDLKVLERARGIAVLRESYGLSVREIASRLGFSKSMVQRSLEILSLPEDLLEALKEGASESKVMLLAQIDDPELRAVYLKDLDLITRAQLKVDLNNRDSGGNKRENSGGRERDLGIEDPQDSRITEEIQEALGLKVKLQRAGKGAERGKLTVEFYSDEDLQEIFRRLVQDD